MVKKYIESTNSFQILEEEGEGKEKGEKEGQNNTQESHIKGVMEEIKENNMSDIMEEDEAEEMELRDLDLDALEK